MVNLRRIALGIALATGFAAIGGVRAGTVILKNGDHITGAITRVGAVHVTVKTAYAGVISIPVADIKTLSSNTPVVLAPAKGPAQMATLSPAPSGYGWVVAPVNMPVPPAPKPPAKAPEAVSWFGPDWQNELDLGAMDAAGNSNSTQFTGALNLNYRSKPDEVSINLTGGMA